MRSQCRYLRQVVCLQRKNTATRNQNILAVDEPIVVPCRITSIQTFCKKYKLIYTSASQEQWAIRPPSNSWIPCLCLMPLVLYCEVSFFKRLIYMCWKLLKWQSMVNCCLTAQSIGQDEAERWVHLRCQRSVEDYDLGMFQNFR